MKFGDITKRLSGTHRFKETKTNENMDRLFASDKQPLTVDQLGYVAGGGRASRAGSSGKMEKWIK